MKRSNLLQQVKDLRAEGKSVRAVAAELGVYKSRVQRALKALALESDVNETSPAEVLTVEQFVGRRRELAALQSALENTLSGQGRLVMLLGEPGIGKTRTAQEFATYAGLRDVTVLWGRCYENMGTPPYWPWVQAIRAYVRDQGAAQVRSEMGIGAGDIAEIVPGLREILPDFKPSPLLGNQTQARLRLFDSVTSFLKSAATTRPLVLILDNLHWADRPSLLLLEFLATELAGARILLLGTYRDVELSTDNPLYQTLGELTKEPHFQRMPLAGLAQEEVANLIAFVVGIVPPQELVEAVYRQTDGNPLFVTEAARLLSQEGGLTSDGMLRRALQAGDTSGPNWDLGIPDGVKEAISRRLYRLSWGCGQILTIASVIGRQFGLDLLSRLVEQQPEERLLNVLEEALTARIIEEVPDVVGRYQFTHALIQNTLEDQLSATRRARLHGDIGQALEEVHSANLEEHAAELAYHFVQSESVLAPEKLVRYSLMAGDRALSAYAHEDALAHYQRALLARGVPVIGNEPAEDAQAAELLWGQGRAQAAILPRLRLPEVVASLGRALEYYARVADVTRIVAIAECPFLFIITGYFTGVGQLLARGLNFVQPDSLEAGRLLYRYGLVLAMEEGDYQGARNAFSKALAIAQREGDTTVEMATLVSAAQAELYDRQFQEAREWAMKAIKLAQQTDAPRVEIVARYYIGLSTSFVGDLEEMGRQAAALIPLADKVRDRLWLASTFALNQSFSQSQGNWQTARDFNDQGLAAEPQYVMLISSRALTEYEVGNFELGAEYLERLLERMRQTPPGPSSDYYLPSQVIPMVALITGVIDNLEIAESAANVVLASPVGTSLTAIFPMAGMALVAVLRGDATSARGHYQSLESAKGTMLMPNTLSIDRVLGLLAQTMGNPDQAAAHFGEAIGFCRNAGYRPELAWSCHDYAEALLQRSGADDHQRVTSLLDEALSISGELGMRPLMERVTDLQAQAQARPVPMPAYPDGLTQREVEVLRLMAAGRTDREIGEELFISVKTVGNHVSNILNKTNTANRTEAASYAAIHGLTMNPGPDTQ